MAQSRGGLSEARDERARAAAWLGVPAELMAAVPPAVVVAILRRADSSDTRPDELQNELIEHLRGSISSLREAAYLDPLTGLPNRGAIERRLRFELERAQFERSPVALLLADVDGFKAVNDRLGHPAGDQVLRVVASRLRGAIRQGDAVGRWGGDEFVVICPGASDAAVRRIATHVADSVASQSVIVDAAHLIVTVSVGCAVSVTGNEADLIAAADAAMYRSKGGHRIAGDAVRRVRSRGSADTRE